MTDQLLAPAAGLLAQVSAEPDANGLPGANAVEKLVNGVFFFTLVACVLGFFLALATWAVASRAQNHHYAQQGKMGVLICAIAAFLAGAGPAIIRFFYNAGETV